MNDYKNIAVDLYPDGEKVSEVIFDALKRVMGGVDNYRDARFWNIKGWKFLIINEYGHYVFSSALAGLESKPHTEILGKPLMDAIEQGYTPWFEGDEKPRFSCHIAKSDGWFSKGCGQTWTWDCKTIAYKKAESKATKNPSIESKMLAEKVTAAQILEAGIGHMKDRATTYDKPDGERSMGATVEAFESITGHSLTEEQGWLFMGVLKMVRSQQGDFKLDNYEDGAAYFALQGESAQGRTK